MKKITERKYYIDSLDFDHSKNEWVFKTNYQTMDHVWYLKPSDLSINDTENLIKYSYNTHDLYLYSEGLRFLRLEAKESKVKKGSPIDKFERMEFEKLDYINYHHYNLFTQLDGITAIVGMTGGGKTYSALAMLPLYSRVFDKIAYLNYELTDRDIDRRLKEMYDEDETLDLIFDKLYIKKGVMTSLNLEDILEAMDIKHEEKVVFIIDNVGSVIGQEDNVWRKQNEFLKDIDTICKERGFHALALTQIVKDHNMKLFNEAGEFLPTITASIMSGSIVLANLARTVLLTGFNGNDEYKRTVLKKGTGLFYTEKGDNIKDAIKR